MYGKSRLSSTLRPAAALVLAVLVAPALLRAQSAPSKGGKISEEDLKKLRQLEMKAGVRTKAAEAPEVQALKGPPLTDREKVTHVLNRLSFGPTPGQVDKVLAGKRIGPQNDHFFHSRMPICVSCLVFRVWDFDAYILKSSLN